MVNEDSLDNVLSNDREAEKLILVGDCPYVATVDECLEQFAARRVATDCRIQFRSPAMTEESFARVLPQLKEIVSDCRDVVDLHDGQGDGRLKVK